MQKYKELDIYKYFIEAKRTATKATNYFEVYEELLSKYRNKKIVFVEIGVKWGGSLQMWKKYFGDQARIIGIDFHQDVKKLEHEGFEIYIGDQSSKEFWKDFFEKVGKVDVIIDDGGHTNTNQIITLNCCLSNINNDGILITEDVDASYSSKFNNPQKYSFINYCKFLVDDINSKTETKSISTKLIKKNSHSKNIYSIKFFTGMVAFFINREKNQFTKKLLNNETLETDIIKKDFVNPRWNSYKRKPISSKLYLYLKEKMLFKNLIEVLRKINIFIRNQNTKKKLKKYFK